MQFLKDNKLFIGVALAAIVGLYVYFAYFGGGSNAPLLTASGENDAVTPDILQTLSSLHTIKLDNTIFEDPIFLSLTNFGVELPPESVGRRNPFAPVGSN